MAAIDIRIGEDDLIDEIRFASSRSSDDLFYSASTLKECDVRYVLIDDGDMCIRIMKKDIPNLIKALQKAQEIWKD